jgi:hypothetical protein
VQGATLGITFYNLVPDSAPFRILGLAAFISSRPIRVAADKPRAALIARIG